MHLPTWNELIDEQRAVMETPVGEPLFVAGPPGSGKTVLAVARARMIADNHRRLAVITYNRMLRRLVSLLEGGTAYTMQTFVCRDYWKRAHTLPPKRPNDDYALDWDAILTTLDGHSNAGHVLKDLVVDEGQDLPQKFFEYARRHVAGTLSVFADDDQALGERRTTLEQIKAATLLPDPIILEVNHRNTPEIAAVAEHFHDGRLPAATVRRASLGERPWLISASGLRATCDRIAAWVETRGGTVGVVVSANSTGATIHASLAASLPGRRVDIYTDKLKNEDTIALLEPGVTILNEKSVKGQEFDTMFLLELESFLPCDTEQKRRVMYMLCARARDNLIMMYGPRPLSAEAVACLPPASVLERT